MALERFDRIGWTWPELVRRMWDPEELGGWMRLEEVQEDDRLVIRAELPGIDPDKDVEITVRNGLLSIQATRQERSEDKEKGSFRSEFRYGSFSRSVALPADVSVSDVEASYADGILEVRVPIAPPVPPESTRIEVKRA